MSTREFAELSPTHHPTLERIFAGTASPEEAAPFRAKYPESLESYALRAGRQLRIRCQHDLEDGAQEVLLAYVRLLDPTQTACQFQPDGNPGSFRRYLRGLAWNVLRNDRQRTARDAHRLAVVIHELLADERDGPSGVPSGSRPVQLSRELSAVEYQDVLKDSLEAWLAKNFGPLRVIYDALVEYYSDPDFDPKSINTVLATRLHLLPANVYQCRCRLRKALQLLIARNVSRRLNS